VNLKKVRICNSVINLKLSSILPFSITSIFALLFSEIAKLKEQVEEQKKLEEGNKDLEKKLKVAYDSLAAKDAASKKDLNQMKQAFENERKWLLTEGFQSVATMIHQDGLLAKACASVNSAINACGFNEGIKAGFAYAREEGYSVETTPGFEADAEEKLDQAVKNFNNLEFSSLKQFHNLHNVSFAKLKESILAKVPKVNPKAT
jgi:hypothetical protein